MQGGPQIQILLLLLLLLSHFSRVRLCATPLTAAHQAPPSLGFSRQEHWSGLHFLLQCRKVKSESEVTQEDQANDKCINWGLVQSGGRDKLKVYKDIQAIKDDRIKAAKQI